MQHAENTFILYRFINGNKVEQWTEENCINAKSNTAKWFFSVVHIYESSVVFNCVGNDQITTSSEGITEAYRWEKDEVKRKAKVRYNMIRATPADVSYSSSTCQNDPCSLLLGISKKLVALYRQASLSLKKNTYGTENKAPFTISLRRKKSVEAKKKNYGISFNNIKKDLNTNFQTNKTAFQKTQSSNYPQPLTS